MLRDSERVRRQEGWRGLQFMKSAFCYVDLTHYSVGLGALCRQTRATVTCDDLATMAVQKSCAFPLMVDVG